MNHNTPIVYWRKDDWKTTLTGTLEDLKRGDVFHLEGKSDHKMEALMDAQITSDGVIVPSKDFKDPFEKLFGQCEYDSEGYMKVVHTSIDSWPNGFEIRYSAKGYGFGGVAFFVRKGKFRTDTECTSVKTLTAIIRAAAPALAQFAYDNDPFNNGSEEDLVQGEL